MSDQDEAKYVILKIESRIGDFIYASDGENTYKFPSNVPTIKLSETVDITIEKR